MAVLLMTMVPRFVLVKVHVTVSPASAWKVAVFVLTSPVLGVTLLPSSQLMLVRSQSAATVSVDV